MMRSFRYTLAMLAGATLLASCGDADALTSPIGTTVASVRPAAGLGYMVVFEGAPPAGFADWVARQGGTVAWLPARAPVALVAGLPDAALASLLRVREVAEVRRVRIRDE